MLTHHEVLQLQLDALHRNSAMEDAAHRREINANVQRCWPATLQFIDSLKEAIC